MSEDIPTLDDTINILREYFDRKPVATLTTHEKLHKLDHWQRQFTWRFRIEIDKRPELKGYVVGWGGLAVALMGVVTTIFVDPIVGPPMTFFGACLSVYERYDNWQETESVKGYSSLLDWRIRVGMSLYVICPKPAFPR